MKRWCCAPLAALVLLVTPFVAIAAKGQRQGDGFKALEKQVHEFRLPNGLTFLVLERREAPVFSFRTYVNVGGVDEVAGITGIAHMFEHMAFKGTPHVGTTDYAAEQEAMEKVEGAWNQLINERRRRHVADSTRIAALEEAFKAAQKEADQYVVANEYGKIVEKEGATGLNAFTGVDYTQYLYNLPSNKLVLWALMEGDRMTQPVLREFYKERDVVIEERRMGSESSPSGRLFEEMLVTSFKAHPYGNGVIGHRSDLESFSRLEAEEFFRKHYVARNMVVSVVGDFDAKEVESLAHRYFSGIADGPVPPPVDTVEPRQQAERRVVMEDDAQPIIFVGYHMPAFSDRRYPAYDALSEVMGDGRSCRLYTSLVKEQKIAVQVGGMTGMPGRKYPNLMFYYIVPAAGVDPDSALAAFDAEIQRLLDGSPVKPDELAGVKTRSRAQFWRQVQSNAGLAGQLATYQGMTGDWRNLFREVDRVNAVTVDDVMKAARDCLRKGNRTVAILRPRSEAS